MRGKTHDFGGNIQALFYPSEHPLWILDVLPGNVHDLAAARKMSWACCGRSWRRCWCWPMPGTKVLVTASSGPVKKPARVKELDIYTRARNALIRSVRCLGERGFAGC